MRPSEKVPGNIGNPLLPFVSVIVPVYNGADGIELLLDALKAQNYSRHRFEILIVDNGSQDGTMAMVETFARQHPELPLRLLAEHEKRGSYAARNKAVAEAKGSILAFTDADCRPVQGWITAGVAKLDESGSEQVAGAVEFTFAKDQPNPWEHIDSVVHLKQELYAQWGFAATANLFVRADALARVNGFRTDLKSGGDYEFGKRMKAAGFRIVYCPEALVRHPARATHKEVAGKVRRVASGLETLARDGLFPPLRPRELLPQRRVPGSSSGPKPGLVGQAVALLLVNYLHYLRLGTRLAARARRA